MRKPGQMTSRRRQLLDHYTAMIRDGGGVSYARLARECGLYSHSDAIRIIGDLKKMRLIN